MPWSSSTSGCSRWRIVDLGVCRGGPRGGGPQGDRTQDRARGLRSIMEGILLDTMFDLPSLEGVEEVVISKEVVEGTARPLYIYADRSDRTGESGSASADIQTTAGRRRTGADRLMPLSVSGERRSGRF